MKFQNVDMFFFSHDLGVNLGRYDFLKIKRNNSMKESIMSGAYFTV